jgi:phosphoenolpyruvate phosphomutase
MPAASRRGASPGRRLRQLLYRPALGFLMEAHDGLSARIAEVEGFEAIWASGFSISTALGLRDSGEASWSQVLATVETMIDAVSVPVLVDADAGYGNFNTARRFVRKAENLGVAGACIEDKVSPKMNSFAGDRHELLSVGRFCGMIEACKEAQREPDFCLVARTETLIAGRPVAEALDRAHAYREAGADAIFVHSRRDGPEEIAAFADAWGRQLPVVIAPTTYARTPTARFDELGIAAVIWANQSLRAAIAAMRQTCRQIRRQERVDMLEARLAPLAEIFGLLGYDELDAALTRFMGSRGDR